MQMRKLYAITLPRTEDGGLDWRQTAMDMLQCGITLKPFGALWKRLQLCVEVGLVNEAISSATAFGLEMVGMPLECVGSPTEAAAEADRYITANFNSAETDMRTSPDEWPAGSMEQVTVFMDACCERWGCKPMMVALGTERTVA